MSESSTISYSQALLAGESWQFFPSGFAYWGKEQLGVVSDLHLSKGASFASNGSFLPPYDSHASLSKLSQDLRMQPLQTLLFLGDSYHDARGSDHLDSASQCLLGEICREYEVIWIIGNHDEQSAAQHEKACLNYTRGPLRFSHIPSLPAELPEGVFEIAGHLHPKAVTQVQGRKIRRPCYLQTPQQLILPAYGSYTGGIDLSHPVFEPHLQSGYTVHLTTKRSVLVLP